MPDAPPPTEPTENDEHGGLRPGSAHAGRAADPYLAEEEPSAGEQPSAAEEPSAEAAPSADAAGAEADPAAAASGGQAPPPGTGSLPGSAAGPADAAGRAPTLEDGGDDAEEEDDDASALLADAAEALVGGATGAAADPGADPEAPADPPPAPAPLTPAQREQAVVAAANRRRQQLVIAGWLQRAGIACTLVLLVLAAAVYVARRTTADAAWTAHLAWLAVTLPLIAWALYHTTARSAPPAERLRTQVERELRRRDELPLEPTRAASRTPVAGTLAAGAAALLVVLAGAVPVARPRLEQAASTVTRQALGVESKAEALRNAGVAGDGAAGVREQIRGLATPPRSFEEAARQQVGLARIEADLDAAAHRVAERAEAAIAPANAAAALAAAFDLTPPPPPVAPDPPAPDPDAEPEPEPGAGDAAPAAPPPPRPGGLPPGAATALLTLAEQSVGDGLAAGGEASASLPGGVAASLRQAEAAGEPPPAATLAEVTRFVLDRRAAHDKLLQRLAEGGFATGAAVAVTRTDPGRIDSQALAAALRGLDTVDADAVLAACATLR
ncbi:hypothetical protein [Phycisphaera mikurensis]|uniref:Uncharacterized protein n=1 Tax=Phycisphaera mikurensis (strain NBRC 102666 / KCTC 22515 / FYK2301M01) TaxID=1142394 RepID=I0IAH7_PHYMF|nr:hypothetical protein [Phycisphaera mikurensis]MBB6441738.1 hypothetical protein [Phycisphaera mikurensis]BAM02265.1 hypothetical protein PSMK_01060 [Phycisphaera mikurensis NBRC 102666]